MIEGPLKMAVEKHLFIETLSQAFGLEINGA